MKITKLKKIIFLFLFFSCIFFSIFIKEQKKNILKVSFLDVGQGDSCLVMTPGNKNLLIDGGPDNLFLRRIGEEMPFFMRTFDVVVVSHFHQDHIVGLIEFFRRYRVNNLLYASEIEEYYPAKLLFEEAKKQKTNILPINGYFEFILDDYCKLEVFSPDYFLVKENENNSLLTKISCGEFSFLSAGDNELLAEEAILKSNIDLSSIIFKSSHHGSLTSNSEAFLKSISPEFMIISVGENNPFDHPSEKVLKRAENLGIKVKRTDFNGTINMTVKF